MGRDLALGPLGSQQHLETFSRCRPPVSLGLPVFRILRAAALPGGHHQCPIFHLTTRPTRLFLWPSPFPYTFVPGEAARTPGRASWLCLEGADGPLESRLSPCPWQKDWQLQCCSCPRLSTRAPGVSPGAATGLGRPRSLITSAQSRVCRPRDPCRLRMLSDPPPPPMQCRLGGPPASQGERHQSK